MTIVKISPIPTKLSALALKLGAFVALSDAELTALEQLNKRRRTFVAGRDLVHQGQSEQAAYVLAAGWACSYKLLENGERQIVDFQIPGDFLGLRSVLLHLSDHSIEPITDIEASEVLATDLLGSFAQTSRLAEAVLWAASRDEAMVVEHLVGIGRRNAAERMAHFLLELGARLALVGLSSKSGFDCPLSQYLMADALGLSAVHVNRVLRQLREDGMVTFRDGFVSFDDYDGLIKFADFDPTYLDQIGPISPIDKRPNRLCCTNPVRDSCCESSVVAGLHEQTHSADLQDHELDCLQ